MTDTKNKMVLPTDLTDVSVMSPIDLPDRLDKESRMVGIRPIGKFDGKAIWFMEGLRPVIGVDEYGVNILVFEEEYTMMQ